MTEIQNWNDWELAQLHEQRKLDAQKFNEQRDLEFDKEQADNFFGEETKELLKIDSDEIKQIEKNLWPDESKDFLAEIKGTEDTFTEYLNVYKSNISFV